jgi:hypothetical protein
VPAELRADFAAMAEAIEGDGDAELAADVELLRRAERERARACEQVERLRALGLPLCVLPRETGDVVPGDLTSPRWMNALDAVGDNGEPGEP